MKIETIENIPAWAMIYIEYGDDSALITAEKEMIDDFIASLADAGLRLIAPIDGSENGFCRYPAFGLATNTIDYSAERI